MQTVDSTNFKSERIDSYCDLFSLHKQFPERYPFLLESVAHGTGQAQFDILFAFPGESLALESFEKLQRNNSHIQAPDFLTAFDQWWQSLKTPAQKSDLPFTGGWFVYLGYELAQQIEPRLQLTRTETDLPIAMATRIPAAIIRSHEQQCLFIIAENSHAELLGHMQKDIMLRTDSPASPKQIHATIQEEDSDVYIKAVERARRYIVDGDIFQANLSRLWEGTLEQGISPESLYENLRTHNPAPFSGFISINNASIISSSPERLVSVHNNIIETRPIAGTRPRSFDAKADMELQKELMSHPKEQAEHIMLIDLERNDLGRVCMPGTVNVNELMVLESYTHVHHIVSNVQGVLKKDIRPGDVIRAVFPGGTITGCPKVRCMEIIQELEHAERGPYTGSMGYINRDGSLDLNILIRTIVYNRGKLGIRAGAGIVADSVPEKELDETRAKAKGMLRALGVIDT